MKNLVLVLVLICCFLIGFYIRQHYFLRKEFFKKIQNFIEKLINNICYNNEKLNIFLNREIDGETDKLFKFFLLSFKRYLENELSYDELYLENKKMLKFLKVNELEEILKFLVDIGKRTKDEEIYYLNRYLNAIKEKNNLSKENYCKYANLYFKLFIILGVIIFIIFL